MYEQLRCRPLTRRPDDAYYTPSWVTEALFSAWKPPPAARYWCDPSAGEGAIPLAITHPVGRWLLADIREECAEPLRAAVPGADIAIVDTLTWEPPREPDVVITNPPYSHALEFVQWGLRYARVATVMLLRLGFLESQKRAPFLRANMPDVYVLSRRPSFTGEGTDASAYAWFIWPALGHRGEGRIVVL